MTEHYVGKHPEDPRKPGQSYRPRMWSPKRLKMVEDTVGPYVWSALYQQRANPEKGVIIQRDWIKFWEREPQQLDEILISGDLAFKKTVDASRVAFHVWGRKEGKFYLLDREAKQMDFVETLETFIKIVNANPKAYVKLIEDKANGPALQSVLKDKVPGLIMVPVDTDKAGRLRAVAPFFRSASVFLPSPEIHPWSTDVAEELVKFPNSEYNDDTDTLSQALSYWGVPGVGAATFEEWNW
jgi:predicted phage terminase large subunit-like protein